MQVVVNGLICERISHVASTGPCKGKRMMNMLRKGQIRGVEKRDSLKQATFIASLFGVAI